MTRNNSAGAPRRARGRIASFRLASPRLSPRSAAALFVAWALLVPPPVFAARGDGRPPAVPSAFAWALALAADAAKKVLPAAAPTARRSASAAAQLLPARRREADVAQLVIPSLPLHLNPPPLEPPDQNTQVYGPLVLMSQEPINLTALPLDADGDAVHGVQPWWYSTDRTVVYVTRDGQALAGNPGAALLTAQLGTIKAVVAVTVVPNSQPYGGQKPDSTRTLPATPPLLGRGDREGARFVNASWTPDAEARPAARRRGARGGVRFVKAAQAARPRTGRRRPDYEERLPDNETGSLYEPRNDVGTPPGQTEPGARTPPAAVPFSAETPGSDNFIFNVPVARLAGRTLDVNLNLVYNSRLWHRSTDAQGGAHMTYDVDAGWPAPGFRLGYGYVEAQGSAGFTLVEPDGSRHPLAKVNPFNPNDFTYETTDATFIRFVGGQGWGTATYPNGTRVDFGAAGDTPRSYPIKITDRNGNFILVSYRDGVGPHLSNVQDTMGRYVRFRYQANDLVSITVPGYNGGGDTQTIRLYYEALPIAGTFTTDRVAPPAARVVRYVYFPGSRAGFRYDYSTYGMIFRTVSLRQMTVSTTEEEVMGAVVSEGQVAATTEYDYPTTPALLADAPTYSRRTDDWAGRQSFHSAGPPVHLFTTDKAHGVSTVTAPDGTQTITNTIVNGGSWDDGLVRQVEVKQGGRTFSRTFTTWEHDGSFRNQRPRRIDMTDERGETRSILYGYAAFNNINTLTELGFGGEELRRTHTAYESRPEYINRRLLHLPTNVSVYDGRTNVLKSTVDYAYDESGSNLVPRHDIVMHDPAFRPQALVEESCRWEPDPNDPDTHGCEAGGGCDGQIGYVFVCTTGSPHRAETSFRGNLSSMTTYPRATNPTPETAVVYTYSYDVAGNLLRETADCCQQRAYTYEKAFEYAYPTALARGDAGQLQTRAGYDFNTGLLRQAVDENGQATTIDYYPESLRHQKTTRPDGGFTLTEYGDEAQSFVRNSAVIDAALGTTGDDAFLTNVRRFNGRGEYVRTATRTPDGWTTVDIQYDELGRPRRTSNPYYAADPFSPAANPPGAWTEYSHDGMGRQTQVTSADGNVARADFRGRVTTLTDQAGRLRRTLTDALGRLERVDEPNAAGSLGTIDAPAQPTFYAYDALDKLVTVTQGQQQRVWRYDSMGRITHERQVEQDAPIVAPDPESDGVTNWSRRYEYTGRSQISLVEDARRVVTTMTYDGLNRVKTITHSDGTPAVTYTYDEPADRFFNAGRMTGVSTAAAGTTPATNQEYDYDRLGRVVSHIQRAGVAFYLMIYSYNSLGQLKTIKYPNGRIVVQDYDSGARITRVSQLNGGVYANQIRWAAHGGLASETFGNGALHQVGYNNRLQTSSITLSKGGAVLQRFAHFYGRVNPSTGAVDETQNAGQIARIDDYVGGTAPANKRSDQRFLYDTLGRLDLAAEHLNDGTLRWRADYAYDRYGNLFQSAQPNHQNVNIGYIPVEPSEVNPLTNRLQFATDNLEYDAAGNVRVDPKFRGLRYEYTADNKLRRTTNIDGGAETTSVYDGQGQRVVNTVGTESRHFVYAVTGQVIAEYGPSGWERDRVYRGSALLATEEATGTCRKSIEQFVEAFYRGALDRPPTAAEKNDRVARLRNAQAQSHGAVLAEAQALGRALFESAEYAARQRSNEEFVNDLYWAYLQRAPDSGGYLHWLEYTRVNGRPATVTAFAVSIEFDANVRGLCEAAELTAERHWVLTDHVGSVRVVTNALGEVVGRRDNQPYGQPILDVGTTEGAGAMSSLSSAAGDTGLWTWHNSIRTMFAGMEKDVGTGLDHTPFRKYESALGRWTSPDPYPGSMSPSDPQSFNRYAYARNDPVNRVDPLGLEDLDDDGVDDGPNEYVEVVATSDWWDDFFDITRGGSSVLADMWFFVPLLPMPTNDLPIVIDPPQQPEPPSPTQQLRNDFKNFLTTMSDACKNALKDFLPTLSRLADTASLFDVDVIGTRQASEYLGEEQGRGHTLSEWFAKTSPPGGAYTRRGDAPVQTGIYYRGPGTFSGQNMYLLLHEMMHLAFPAQLQPGMSGDLDQLLAGQLGITKAQGESWSNAVSRFFNSGCAQKSP